MMRAVGSQPTSLLCLLLRSWFVLRSTPAVPPLTAYSAAMAFPDDDPST